MAISRSIRHRKNYSPLTEETQNLGDVDLKEQQQEKEYQNQLAQYRIAKTESFFIGIDNASIGAFFAFTFTDILKKIFEDSAKNFILPTSLMANALVASLSWARFHFSKKEEKGAAAVNAVTETGAGLVAIGSAILSKLNVPIFNMVIPAPFIPFVFTGALIAKFAVNSALGFYQLGKYAVTRNKEDLARGALHLMSATSAFLAAAAIVGLMIVVDMLAPPVKLALSIVGITAAVGGVINSGIKWFRARKPAQPQTHPEEHEPKKYPQKRKDWNARRYQRGLTKLDASIAERKEEEEMRNQAGYQSDNAGSSYPIIRRLRKSESIVPTINENIAAEKNLHPVPSSSKSVQSGQTVDIHPVNIKVAYQHAGTFKGNATGQMDKEDAEFDLVPKRKH